MAARGYQGAVFRAMGVGDHALTVTDVEDPAPEYRRIHFTTSTALDAPDLGPAAWIRLWVPDPGDPEREVQRAFTFVDADAEAGTFAVDFVLHDPPGPAAAWAMTAVPGATLRATNYGSRPFVRPDLDPAGYLLLGDLAALPGLRSVVAAIDDAVPIELYLEEAHATDRLAPLPEHPNLRITWVPTREDGRALADAVAARDWSDWWAWAGGEKEAIKALTTTLTEVHGFPKENLKLAPYWIRGKPMGGKAKGDAPADLVRSAPTITAPAPEPAAASTPALEPVAAGGDASTDGTPRWRSQAGADLLAPLRGTFRVAAVVQALLTVLELVPFLLLVEVARRLLRGQEPAQLRGLAWTALTILGVATLLTSVLVTVLHVVDARFAGTVRRRLVDKLRRLPLGWFTDRNSGSVRGLVVDDTASLHYLITHAVLDLVAALVAPAVVLVYLFVVDARLALVLLVPLIAYGVTITRMAAGSTAQIAEFGRWNARVGTEITANLEGAAVIRAYGGSGDGGLRRTVADYVDFVSDWQVPLGRRKAISAMIARPTTFLWVIALAGTALAAAGTMSPTTLLTFLVVGVTFGPKLLGAAYGVSAYRESRAAAQRIGLVLAEAELAEPDQPVTPVPGPNGAAVAFRDLTFGYEPGRPVLHDVDLDLVPGAVTALVGPSGSGKSTLAALLARFHDPDAGAVTIEGHDLRQIPATDLRRLVGFVFQDVHVVRGTVRENLTLGRPDATDDEVRAAAAAADIAARIDRLPAGYDTVLDGEVRLSGGETQRLAIARTMLADPPILVLDEATAFADPESEHRVQEALSRLVAGRTVLVIAHRLHTITGAAKIVVLDQGRVVEQGRHADLLAADGRYAALWAAGHPEAPIANPTPAVEEVAP